MKYLIVNADDFGASAGVNRGILEAHTSGVVTSASLMINMPATEQAIAAMRAHPDLSVGLHVNLTNEGGDPVVDLNDATACARELRRQFEGFVSRVGCPPTHLDSHHNVHLETSMATMFVEFADDKGVPLRGHSPATYFRDFYGQWDGVPHPEQISVENLIAMLSEAVGDGLTELSCHPGYRDPRFRTWYDQEREIELATLRSPTLARFLDASGINLVGFRELAGLTAHAVPAQETP